MNMAKKLVLAAGLTLLGGAAAFGEYARGYFNNWENDCPLTLPEGGNYYPGTFQAHAGDARRLAAVEAAIKRIKGREGIGTPTAGKEASLTLRHLLRAFQPHVVYVISWGLGQSPRSKLFSEGSKCGCDARSLGEVVTEPIFSTVGVLKTFCRPGSKHSILRASDEVFTCLADWSDAGETLLPAA